MTGVGFHRNQPVDRGPYRAGDEVRLLALWGNGRARAAQLMVAYDQGRQERDQLDADPGLDVMARLAVMHLCLRGTLVARRVATTIRSSTGVFIRHADSQEDLAKSVMNIGAGAEAPPWSCPSGLGLVGFGSGGPS